MQEFLLDVAASINNYLSNYILIILLVGIGLFYTIKTKFVQVRCFGEGMKNVFGNIKLKGGSKEGGLSSFQALATAIAAIQHTAVNQENEPTQQKQDFAMPLIVTAVIVLASAALIAILIISSKSRRINVNKKG